MKDCPLEHGRNDMCVVERWERSKQVREESGTQLLTRKVSIQEKIGDLRNKVLPTFENLAGNW
jgi:hypothetical protein